ncbi:hypothetical protein D0T60_09380 [Bacteroides sp. 224]|nr:hypothetical protein [Bacteroides sp. 224]
MEQRDKFESYDFVFFDLSDTMNNRDLVLALASMDYIKTMCLLWNLVDGKGKSDLYDVYEGVIKELKFTTLKILFLATCVSVRNNRRATVRPFSLWIRQNISWELYSK